LTVDASCSSLRAGICEKNCVHVVSVLALCSAPVLRECETLNGFFPRWNAQIGTLISDTHTKSTTTLCFLNWKNREDIRLGIHRCIEGSRERCISWFVAALFAPSIPPELRLTLSSGLIPLPSRSRLARAGTQRLCLSRAALPPINSPRDAVLRFRQRDAQR